MIHTVVFDIGQVLVDFKWEPYIESLGFEEEKTRRLKEATVLGSNWNQQDKGSYGKKELLELFLSLDNGIESELSVFLDRIEEIVEERKYAVPLIQSLKKEGYGVYLLSNYGKFAFENAKKKFTFLNYVDGSVISYEVNSIKPEEKIYGQLLKKYNLKPEECFFLDDRQDNIDTAKKIGFHTILFEGIEQAMTEMGKAGIRTTGLVF